MLYNSLMKTFGSEQYRIALSYLKNQARPLEYLRWNFFIGKSNSVQVLRELEKFRNNDGGFGKALEPDMRSEGSSVLAVVEALAIMAELGIQSDEPLLSDALNWLTDSGGAYDSGRGIWPYLPADIDNSPGAPWWDTESLEETFSGFLVNPRARILSFLYRWEISSLGLLSESVLESVLESTVELSETLPVKVSPDTLRSLLMLFSEPSVPELLRIRAESVIRKMIPESVETDSEKWSEYCLQPLEVVESPDSLWMDLLSDSVQRHLDFLIRSQNPDGSWSPFWSWGGVYPEVWQEARREWAGILTYRNLRHLSSFGRFTDTDRL